MLTYRPSKHYDRPSLFGESFLSGRYILVPMVAFWGLNCTLHDDERVARSRCLSWYLTFLSSFPLCCDWSQFHWFGGLGRWLNVRKGLAFSRARLDHALCNQDCPSLFHQLACNHYLLPFQFIIFSLLICWWRNLLRSLLSFF